MPELFPPKAIESIMRSATQCGRACSIIGELQGRIDGLHLTDREIELLEGRRDRLLVLFCCRALTVVAAAIHWELDASCLIHVHHSPSALRGALKDGDDQLLAEIRSVSLRGEVEQEIARLLEMPDPSRVAPVAEREHEERGKPMIGPAVEAVAPALSKDQWTILAIFSEKPFGLLQADLAADERMQITSRGAISRCCKNLAAKGYIANGGKRTGFTITQGGRDMLSASRAQLAPKTTTENRGPAHHQADGNFTHSTSGLGPAPQSAGRMAAR